MLRGIIFDFDGVIVDSHLAHKRAWERFLASVGKKVSEEDLEFVLDGRKREEILRHFLGELNEDQLRTSGQQKEQFFRGEAANVRTIEGVQHLLDELRQAEIALGVASSGSRSRVDSLLKQLELRKHFRAIVTGDEVPQGKPDPALFLKAAQALQIDPCELLAVEDAVSGVRAARAAGMRCLGIAEGERAPLLFDAGANRVVPNFASLSLVDLQEFFS